VVETAKKLAELRGESYEEISAATTVNFYRVCLPSKLANG
jgi:Tat protein secretion system quality control protein TatD with DNase activity